MSQYNTEELKRLQEAEVQILAHFDAFCQRHGLRYVAAYGTVLGAARHQGFIPWDDDTDLMMPRADYERLLELYDSKAEAPFYLQHFIREANCPTYYAKIRLDGSALVEREIEKLDLHKGIFVDIFPIDRLPEGEKARKRWRFWTLFYLQLYVSKTISRINRPLKGVRAYVYEAIRKTLHLCLLPVPKSFLFRKLEAQARRYEGTEGRSIVLDNWLKCSFEEDEVFPASYLPFDGLNLPVPKNWEAYLKQNYGDYMTLPPVEQRRNHRPLSLTLPEMLEQEEKPLPTGKDGRLQSEPKPVEEVQHEA